MANLKEIRGRITSVSSTMQITSAMKMVSAAKLKRAQDAITQMRPYADKLHELLANLTKSLDVSENKYADNREARNVLLVVVTSNRGLCGAFNNNVIKQAKKLAFEDYKGSSVSVLPVGKKATDAFRKTDLNIKDSLLPKHLDSVWDDLTFENASKIAENLMERFEEKSLDKIILVYNRFLNAASQNVATEQFLPILPPDANVDTRRPNVEYIFEPGKEEIVRDLIPKSLKIQLFKSLLESHAGEHGARMTAMHKATDNARDLKRELSLTYNKARQAAITNEILEIVGGAEALNN